MIFSPSTSASTREAIMRRCDIKGQDQLGTYLGLPTDFKRTKKEVFAELIEQVRKKITSWNGFLLSPAGRLTLISSVLSNLSIYYLSVFKLPVSVSKKINSLLTQFWWAGPREGKTIHWCSKAFLGLPKRQGGLGIRDIECINQALLAKQAWKILKEPNSLVGKVIGRKYGLTIDTFKYVLENPPTNTSWGWKGILWGLRLIDKELAWKVGRPSFLRTWETKWVDGNIPQRKEEISASSEDVCGDYVSDLMTSNYEWNREIVVKIMADDWVNKVLAVPIPQDGKLDRFYWNGTPSGEYNAKSGYHLAVKVKWEEKGSNKDRGRKTRFEEASNRCNPWTLPGPPKWKIFVWKIMTDTLPLGSEFQARSIGEMHYCQICGNEGSVETQEHLFRDCPIAERLWASTDLGVRSSIGRECSFKTWLINWLALLGKGDNPSEATILFIAVMWSLWCLRNDIIFRHSEISFMKLINHYRETVVTIGTSHKQETARIREMKMGRGRMEEEGIRLKLRNHFPHNIVGNNDTCQAWRIKVDAAWKRDGKAAMGWVCMTDIGRTRQEGSSNYRAQSALQAEMMAIKEALSRASENRILHVWILSDCLQAIEQIAGVTTTHHHIQNTIEEVLLLSALFHCCCISYIPRALNMRAHVLAQKANIL